MPQQVSVLLPVLGKRPRLELDLQFPRNPAAKVGTKPNFVKSLDRSIRRAHKLAADSTKEMTVKALRTRVRAIALSEGDLVLLRKETPRTRYKLAPRWEETVYKVLKGQAQMYLCTGSKTQTRTRVALSIATSCFRSCKIVTRLLLERRNQSKVLVDLRRRVRKNPILGKIEILHRDPRRSQLLPRKRSGPQLLDFGPDSLLIVSESRKSAKFFLACYIKLLPTSYAEVSICAP